MLLSTMTGGISLKLGDKEAIRMIAEAGFDSYDFSMHAHGDDSPVYNDGYREYAENLKQFADECNIPCTQAHAFFPSGRYGDDEFNKMAFNKIVRGMEVSSILGAKCIVVHPIKQFPEDIEIDVMQYNIDFYNSLLPYCKKFNIKVALENMFFRDKKRGHITNSVCGFGNEFAEYLEKLDSEWFVACLDIGHSGLSGDEPHRAIRTLGKKYLKALHVHDNDYRDDLHTLPFLGQIEWDKVCNAFAEIDYNEEFTYEADSFLKKFPEALFPDAFGGKISYFTY